MTHGNVRIVLDTNVLLSALIFGGQPRKVVELLSHARIDVVVSEAILSEMRRKVTTKFPDFYDELAQMEALLEQDAELVRLGSITIDACRDPDDNRILETAVLGECGFIISGDKDLLVLGSYEGIQIVNSSQFLSIN